MRPILSKVMAAALAVSVSMGMGVAPTLAESNGGLGFQGFGYTSPYNNHYRGQRHHYNQRHYRHSQRHYRHHRGNHYRYNRSYYRHRDNGAGIAAGLITGAIIGGIAANAMGNGGGNSHVNWCYNRYRSYRASDNTFQPYHGPRRQCVSPY